MAAPEIAEVTMSCRDLAVEILMCLFVFKFQELIMFTLNTYIGPIYALL